MRNVVLDTDVIIDYLRMGFGSLEDLISAASNREIKLYISSVTLMELFSGDIKRNQVEVIEYIENKIEIINLDQELAKYLGHLRKTAKSHIQLADLIIGGSACYIGAQIATRNKKHFAAISGLKFY